MGEFLVSRLLELALHSENDKQMAMGQNPISQDCSTSLGNRFMQLATGRAKQQTKRLATSSTASLPPASWTRATYPRAQSQDLMSQFHTSYMAWIYLIVRTARFQGVLQRKKPCIWPVLKQKQTKSGSMIAPLSRRPEREVTDAGPAFVIGGACIQCVP